MPLPRVRAGDAITAELFNALVAAVEAGRLDITIGCGFSLTETPAGTILGSTTPPTQLARIVSGPDSQGRYAWQGVYRKPDETYDDLGSSISDRSLADPAYELNSIRAVTPGTRVLLTRSPTTGEWVFTAPPLKLIGLIGAGGIPAMSGATPGQGTVTLQAFNAAGTAYVATATTLTAYNTTATACVAGHYVQMGVGPDGRIHVDVETC